jgi:subtilisin
MVWCHALLASAVLVAQLVLGSYVGETAAAPAAAAAHVQAQPTPHSNPKYAKPHDKPKKASRRARAKKGSQSATTKVASRNQGKEAVVVVLEPAADPQAVARAAGVTPAHIYRHVFDGFAAEVPIQALEGLRRNPQVKLVSPDDEFALDADPAQFIPEGIDRIDVDENRTADIDGGGPALDVAVAVFDTGIAPHPDLRIGGGISCVKDPNALNNNHGHGTHVAGTIAALDNEIGVVGVAPGAELWSVKVASDSGVVLTSSLLCGLDWVAAHASSIDVINMSLGGQGKDGTCDSAPLHLAICNVVGAGVTIVVSAGNDGKDSSRVVPATYEEVLAVSAFADYNGQPGGGADPPFRDGVQCVRFNENLPGVDDDNFAFFSNFGPDVDITATGVCVLSTVPNNAYAWNTGTSMAAPHVAGAVALYLADHPSARPAEVRAWLLSVGSVPQDSTYGITGDPDNHHEPVLHVGPRKGREA